MPTIKKHPNNLKHYRLKRGLTQRDALGALGHASASRLSAWENGAAMPSTGHLMTLATLYGVPVDRLVRDGRTRKARLPAQRRTVQSVGHTEKTVSAEELLDELAGMIVAVYLYQKQEVDFPQTGSPESRL